MDLFKYTFQMFNISQQVTHSMEQEALRTQSLHSRWLVPFMPLKGETQMGAFHRQIFSLSLVQFRSEVQKK